MTSTIYCYFQDVSVLYKALFSLLELTQQCKAYLIKKFFLVNWSLSLKLYASFLKGTYYGKSSVCYQYVESSQATHLSFQLAECKAPNPSVQMESKRAVHHFTKCYEIWNTKEIQ